MLPHNKSKTAGKFVWEKFVGIFMQKTLAFFLISLKTFYCFSHRIEFNVFILAFLWQCRTQRTNEIETNSNLYCFLLFTVLVIVTTANGEDTSIDTRDGEDLMLQCRFSPDYSNRGFIYYWARSSPRFENVAVDEKSLSSTYKWVMMHNYMRCYETRWKRKFKLSNNVNYRQCHYS